MSDESGIDAYVAEQHGVGERIASGTFTLASQKALEKLARFQLPERETWILKLVQAAVCSEGAQAIRITQTRSYTEFVLDANPGWELSTIVEAVFSVGEPPTRGLKHLVVALRTVGIRDKRPFNVALEGADRSLYWSGLEFSYDAPLPLKGVRIAVSHQATSQNLSWLRSLFGAASINSTVGSMLSKKAFCCPIPLFLDNRRLDALQHSVASGKAVLMGSFQAEGLPEIETPKGTDELPVYQTSFKEERPQSLLYTVGMVSGSFLGIAVSQRKSSHFYWVLDGVCIESERLDTEESDFFVRAFVSADGLRTDLSSFSLVDSQEKQVTRLRMLMSLPEALEQGISCLEAMDVTSVGLPNNSAGECVLDRAREDLGKTIERVRTSVYAEWNPDADWDLPLPDPTKMPLTNHRERNFALHLLLRGNPTCPYCDGDNSDLKYYNNLKNDRLSVVICQACGRSSRIEEFLTAASGDKPT